MTGSNRRPSACKADALPAELILRMYAQRRPTLTGGNPQLPSAQKSLTSVFGMGTGVASLPSSLDYKVFERQVLLYQLWRVLQVFFCPETKILVLSKPDKSTLETHVQFVG